MLMGITWTLQASVLNAGVKNPTELESNMPVRNIGKPTRHIPGLLRGSLVIQHWGVTLTAYFMRQME